MKRLAFILLAFFAYNSSYGQCESWIGSSQEEQLETYHVIYRGALKSKDWKLAEENWEKVYAAAPLADGERDSHYWDGIDIFKNKFDNESDAGKKAEYAVRILGLYDALAECVAAGKVCEGDCDKKLGFIYGRKAYDMYYTYNQPYGPNMEAIKMAIDKGGLNNEYIIFAPAASIAVYEFKGGRMEKDAVVDLYQKLNEIADYQIENSKDLAEYYDQAKKSMNGTFAEIEDDIFDCEYFKKKLTPNYEEDPENPEVLRYVIATLKQKNCDPSDPFLVEIEKKWSVYAAELNAQKQAEYEANNPALMAKKLYDEEKYDEAIAKYEEAIEGEEDDVKKANLLFAKASIQFRKLKQYGPARATAREAAKLNPTWGRPYMLIGDMYGSGARGCGDAWNQRLAIIAAIDKYNYAKSIDPDVAGDAAKRVGTYSRSLPDQETGFMKGIKAGDSATVGCWIGETVRVRYK